MFKSKDIFKEVKRLSADMQVSAKEFFLSALFGEYLENVAEFMTKRYKRTVHISRVFNKDKAEIAYTNGDDIYINGNAELCNFYTNLNQKFYCWLGILFHEIAHILYLDFPKLKEALKAMGENRWWPKCPDIDNLSLIDEINEYLRDKKATGKVLKMVLSTLSNIVADVHDERAITAKFGGLVEKALATSSYAMHETTPYLEDRIASGCSPLVLVYGLILSYIRFDEIFMEEEDWENEYVKILLECVPYIDEARDAETMEERFENLNKIVTILWPYIKKTIDAIDVSEGGGRSKTGDKSALGGIPGDDDKAELDGSSGDDEESESDGSSGGDEESESDEGKSLSDVLDELETAIGGMRTKVAEGDSKPMLESESPVDGECPVKEFEFLEKALKEEKAEKKLEEERCNELDRELKSIEKHDLHKEISVNYRRKVAVTNLMKERYEEISREIRPYAKTLVRMIAQALKDKRTGSKSYGHLFGNRFESRSLARTDERYFSKKKLPTEHPSLAVGVLVDESGSMCGQREVVARKAAILIEMFTSELEIPTLICGHSTEGMGDFSLYSYVEPGKIDKYDKYRLVDIRARNQNRDGLALKIMCERMSKMTEDIKLLIVISDGQPSDYGYGGPSAEREMQDVCREYRRKGVTIFAAAIGEDRENIHRIYKEGFLDITDLSKLPKTLISLIKKEIKY